MPQFTTAPRVLPAVATASSIQTSVAPATARAPSTTSEDIGMIVEAANALTNRKARSIHALEKPGFYIEIGGMDFQLRLNHPHAALFDIRASGLLRQRPARCPVPTTKAAGRITAPHQRSPFVLSLRSRLSWTAAAAVASPKTTSSDIRSAIAAPTRGRSAAGDASALKYAEYAGRRSSGDISIR